MAKKSKAKKATGRTVKKAAKKAGRAALRAADPHPCYTQAVPGSSQVVQCCWDESINDYRCRTI
jgi:hypothetical protein